MNLRHISRKLTPFQWILLGFAGVILLGALLLMLPAATRSRVSTPFHETLFTATSATCVTGLVVHDTASYWSGFGQAVILVLIQIGGLGVVSVAAMFSMAAGRKLSLRTRTTMQEATSAPGMGGITSYTKFVFAATFVVELVGILALLPVFVPEYGRRGVWMSVFTGISAFCNAGFDLMGTKEAPFVSLTGFLGSGYLNVVIMLLIVVGGLGFLTWQDALRFRHRFHRYRLQSKIALVTSGILILLPWITYFLIDFAKLPFGQRLWGSLFQSVTTRTAGFNTFDLNQLTGAGRTLMILLMLIGGSPGSTAGGMKTTTIAILLASAFSVYRRRGDAQLFGRRVSVETSRNAAAILALYVVLFLVGAMAISLLEGVAMDVCLFETASAVGTVGLTLGLTPSLGMVSQLILICLMFLGRVGGLTLIYATVSGAKPVGARLPQEAVTVG